MRLTYAILKTKSYSQLKRMGATDKQIQAKVSAFYLKEGRQLIVNERAGQTLSKALSGIKKGNVRQGVDIHRTAKKDLKDNLKNLRTVRGILGKESFANKLITQYERGELSVFQLKWAAKRYASMPESYEPKLSGSVVVEDFTKYSKVTSSLDNLIFDEKV